MADSRKIILEIDVNDSDVSALRTELDKTADSFDDVKKSADKANKSVDDVAGNGGAIAILDELTGGLATRFKDAYEATKLFSVSLKGLRTALISTGIGALVVGVGLLVAYWDDIKEAVIDTNANLDRQLETAKNIGENLSAQLATVDKQLELAALQGKSNEELEKQKVAILERLQEQNDAEVKILENQLQRLKATATEVSFWDKIAGNIRFALFGTEGLADVASDLSAQRLKEIKDLETALESAKLKAVDLSIQMFKLQNPDAVGSDGVVRGQVESVNGLTPQDSQILTSAESLFNAKGDILAADFAREQQYAWDRMKLEESVQSAKVQAASQALGLVMQGMDRGAKAYKALAIAQATINTYESANASFKSAAASPITTLFPAYPFIQAGLAVGAGLLNVKNIMKMGKGGGGAASLSSSASSVGVASIPSPQFNVVGNSGVNQLANTLGDQLNTPMRAFITSGDIKTASELEKNSVRESSLG